MMKMGPGSNAAVASSHHPDQGGQSKILNRDMALRSAFPKAFDPLIKDIPLDPNDYPSVRFWSPSQWTSLSQPPKGGIAARLRFLEDEDGEMITEERVDEMRACVHAAFSELHELAPDKNFLPKTWAKGSSGRAVVTACHSELRRRFEEFTFCSGEWKARSFMVEWYPGWVRNHLNSDSDDNAIEITGSVPAKRPAGSSSKRSNKKMRIKTEVKIPDVRDPLYVFEIPRYALTLSIAGLAWILMQHLT